MKVASPQTKVRLNLDLTAKVKGQLEELQKRSEASSLVEVIRRALALYDLVLEVTENDGAVFVQHSDGTKERLCLL